MNQSEYLFYIQISYKLWHIMMFEEKEVKTLKNELSEPTITIPPLHLEFYSKQSINQTEV